MNNYTSRILAIITIILGFLVLYQKGMLAQNVQLNGKTFVVVDSSKSQPIATGYTFVDKTGVKYPVYLSKNGKAFILRKSKKTGKEYRQYLPQVTEKLNSIRNGKRAS